jgi:hypothetical protein
LQRQLGGRADVRLALDAGSAGEGSHDEAPRRTACHWGKRRSGNGLAGIGAGGPAGGSRCCRAA